jgi:hypothetical protein
VRRFVALAASLPLLAVLAVLAGCEEQCSRDVKGCNELANKHEYSVLHAMDARSGKRPRDSDYRIYRNAAESDLTVIAFPRAKSETGYVWLLANSRTPPRDKSVPDEDFVVTPQALAALRAEVELSPEVDRYIAEVAKRGSP